jgi:hypothetical protein
MAIVLAGTVAYVSISGLLTVFSGVGVVGLLFFLAIEISKIVATSAVHIYGKRIGWLYNGLLSLFILIAMGITSMGVYGFLSSGYQKNSTKGDNLTKQISLIDKQIESKEKSKESISLQLVQTQQGISELRTALGNNTQTRVDRNGNIITTSSNSNRKTFELQLDLAIKTEERLNKDINTIDSTINTLSQSKFELETNDELSELGPLRYLAEVTNTSMDNVMKWFILLLILIGDPMAIIMIVIFSKIINKKYIDDGVNDGATQLIGNNTNKIETTSDTINNIIIDKTPITDTVNNTVEPLIDTVKITETKEEVTPNTLTEVKLKEDIKSQKQPNRPIMIEDLPEKKLDNRGFSVKIPDNKKNNIVERVS